MQLDIFYNTIELSGQPLSEATGKAAAQDERILKIMKGADKMTPLQVSRIYNEIYPPCPETSIRRSITSMTKRDILEKCDEMVREKYGQMNHYWRVK